MKRPAYVLIFIITIIVGLSVVQSSVANQISTTGSDLVALQQEITTYKRENMILQEQLLQAASLTNISKKADKLGFVDAKNQVSLTAPLPLARR